MREILFKRDFLDMEVVRLKYPPSGGLVNGGLVGWGRV